VETDEKYTIKVILKTMELLKCFSPEQPEWKATELSKRLHLNRTTVYRILTTLSSGGFVQLNAKTGCFRLGTTLIGLSMALYNSMDIRTVARPVLKGLAKETGESIHLTMWYNDEVILLDQWESLSDIKVSVPLGRRFPAYATSTGKVFLAALPEKELNRYLSEHQLEPLTPRTITNREALKVALQKVSKEQIAFDFEETAVDIVTCAAPVYSFDRNVNAAVAVLGPARRMRPQLEAVAARLKKAGAQISALLGYSADPEQMPQHFD